MFVRDTTFVGGDTTFVGGILLALGVGPKEEACRIMKEILEINAISDHCL